MSPMRQTAPAPVSFSGYEGDFQRSIRSQNGVQHRLDIFFSVIFQSEVHNNLQQSIIQHAAVVGLQNRIKQTIHTTPAKLHNDGNYSFLLLTKFIYIYNNKSIGDSAAEDASVLQRIALLLSSLKCTYSILLTRGRLTMLSVVCSLCLRYSIFKRSGGLYQLTHNVA